ncbi:hypothetical protein [uncultured Selenomonas sp.]|uniref:hypothetical protein n=1 Tax=uncultured Selenomonas sp. TaxID=159275 RepID=UPI0028D5CEAD|nr:hypothetical protein [uncultured Selenomonas sp.]
MKKLPVGIRHLALDSFRDLKLWYYAVIDKPVPVPVRDDYEVNDHVKCNIEFSAPAEIERRRKKLLKARNRLAKYIIAPLIVYWLTKLLS